MERRADYWLKRLDLQEWRGRVTITFQTVDFIKKQTGHESIAGCHWSTEECWAEIYFKRGNGTEENLLHEILHLAIQGHAAYPGYDEMTERAINRLVAGLLA